MGLRAQAPSEVRAGAAQVGLRVLAPGESPAFCSAAPKATHKSWLFFSPPVVTRCHCRKKSDQKTDARERDINVLDPKEVVALATGST